MHKYGYSADALNQINALYYAHPEAFAPHLGLADIYARNASLNRAIGSLLESKIPAHKKHIKIKELSAGSHTEKWKHIKERLISRTRVDVMLSDFELSILTDNKEYAREAYSLFDQLPILPEHQKLDAMLITYGFDSVWLLEDCSYKKENNVWSKVSYSLQFPDNFDACDIHAIEHIQITLQLDPVDLLTEKYGDVLESLYSEVFTAWVNVPGGMIKRVAEAFANQLTPHGVFLVGDAARHQAKLTSKVEPYSTSGRIAKFKIEDYLLVKHVLEKDHGLEVELLTLADVITQGLNTLELQQAGAEIAPFGTTNLNCMAVITKHSQVVRD